MKQKLQFIASTAAASFLTFGALAQDTPVPKTDRTDLQRSPLPHAQRADRLNGGAKASDIIGMTVKNYQDEKLGKVEELAVDVESGRLVQVILSTGGFLGIGDTLTAVPPGALHHDVANQILHLDANKEKLSSAPPFENSRWAESSDSDHLSAVYRYYGEEPAFRFIQSGDSTQDSLRRPDGSSNPNGQGSQDGTRPADRQPNSPGFGSTDTGRSTDVLSNTNGQRNTQAPRDGTRPTDAQPNTPGLNNTDPARNTDVVGNTNDQRNSYARRNAEDPSNTFSTRRPDGTWQDRKSGESQSGQDQSLIPASRLGQLQKASKLMGTPVVSHTHDKLGKVENLLVDLPSGRLVAVVISTGGFLGMGDELSAVPPTALRFTTDRETLRLDASKEMLSAAPHFKANQWPDFAQPSYADGVYRAYKVEPYFTTNVTTEADSTAGNVRNRNDQTPASGNADNTARNARDRDDRTLTPLDQGNSKTDVATTAQIRKEIIAGDNMSVNARNVKIITLNGRVTLRGPVNTAEEKRLIGEIADRIARSENVDNQIEVKLPSTSSINP